MLDQFQTWPSKGLKKGQSDCCSLPHNYSSTATPAEAAPRSRRYPEFVSDTSGAVPRANNRVADSPTARGGLGRILIEHSLRSGFAE